MLDANLTLHDGTAITADKTLTSTTRSGGSVCVDTGEGQVAAGSGIRDLVAILVDPDGLTDTDDTVAVDIQACATVDGTYVDIASFVDLHGSANAAGTVQIIRFSVPPTYRYVRAHIDITDNAGADFSEVLYVFLSNAGFYNL